MARVAVTTDSKPLLVFRNADLGPTGATRPVLESVSLTVGSGEVGVLLGGNGAGKSTLLRSAAGLWSPLGGEVVVGEGDPNAGFDPRRTGLILEEPAAQFVAGSLREELEFTLECQGLSGEAIHRRVDAVLEDLDLCGLASRPARALSSGEQQRALVAAAVITGPPVLLLDDAFLHMGPGEAARLWRWLVERVRREKRQALLLACHVSDLAVPADWVGILTGGRLQGWGRPDAVLRGPLPAGVDPPFLVWLESRLQASGWNLGSGDSSLAQLGSRIAGSRIHEG